MSDVLSGVRANINGERGHQQTHVAHGTGTTGQAQRERGTGDTPRPKANAANTRTREPSGRTAGPR
eukprot:4036262-Prymnesium_polylepis.1